MSRVKSSVRLFAVVLTLSLGSTYTAAQEEDEGSKLGDDAAIWGGIALAEEFLGVKV